MHALMLTCDGSALLGRPVQWLLAFLAAACSPLGRGRSGSRRAAARHSGQQLWVLSLSALVHVAGRERAQVFKRMLGQGPERVGSTARTASTYERGAYCS